MNIASRDSYRPPADGCEGDRDQVLDQPRVESAAVWENQVEGNGGSTFTAYSCTLTRRYKSGKGKYAEGGAFRTAEIPFAIAALHQAFQAILSQESKK